MPYAGTGKHYTGRRLEDGRPEVVPRDNMRRTAVRHLRIDRDGQRELIISCNVGPATFDKTVIDTGSMATCLDEQEYLAHQRAFGPLNRRAADNVRIESVGGHSMGAVGIIYRRVTYWDPRTNCHYTTPRPLELVVVRDLGTPMLLGMSAMAGPEGITHLGTANGDVFFGDRMIRSAPGQPRRTLALRLTQTVHLPAGATQPVRLSIDTPTALSPSVSLYAYEAPVTLASAPHAPLSLNVPRALVSIGGDHGNTVVLPITNPLSHAIALGSGLTVANADVVEEPDVADIAPPPSRRFVITPGMRPSQLPKSAKRAWFNEQIAALVDLLLTQASSEGNADDPEVVEVAQPSQATQA